jgi:hypothetical protein
MTLVTFAMNVVLDAAPQSCITAWIQTTASKTAIETPIVGSARVVVIVSAFKT